MIDNGDQHLREAGIVLPCAKQFGWPPTFYRCNRPYGHTGPHTAEPCVISGARDDQDDARTNFVLGQLLNRTVVT